MAADEFAKGGQLLEKTVILDVFERRRGKGGGAASVGKVRVSIRCARTESQPLDSRRVVSRSAGVVDGEAAKVGQAGVAAREGRTGGVCGGGLDAVVGHSVGGVVGWVVIRVVARVVGAVVSELFDLVVLELVDRVVVIGVVEDNAFHIVVDDHTIAGQTVDAGSLVSVLVVVVDVEEIGESGVGVVGVLLIGHMGGGRAVDEAVLQSLALLSIVVDLLERGEALDEGRRREGAVAEGKERVRR